MGDSSLEYTFVFNFKGGEEVKVRVSVCALFHSEVIFIAGTDNVANGVDSEMRTED